MACRALPGLLALALSSPFTGGCVRRGAGAVEPVGGGGDQTAVAPTGDPYADAIAARNNDLGRRGYRVSTNPVRGQLAAGALTAYPIDAQAGVCYVAFVVTADPAIDFDLFAYDGDGAEVARHVAPVSASAAWLGFCPARTGRHSLHVHAYAGGGEYVYALYEGAAPPQGLEQAFATGGGTAGPTPTASIDPEIEPRVSRTDARLGRDGFARVGSPSGATFGRRESRRVSAALETGRCYSLVALSGARGQDVDLELFSPGGQRVERDDARARDASLQHCPIVAGQFTLQISLADGAGPIWLLGYVKGGGAAPAAPIASFEAVPAPAAALAPAAPDGARHEADHELRARGYEPVGAPLAGALVEAGVASHEVALQGGRCYAFSAAADLPMTAIELAIHDRSAEMARGAAGRAVALARVCPTHAIRVRAEVKAVSGAGAYELRTWAWPGSTQGPFGLSGAIFVRLSEATNVLQRDGLEPSTAPTVVDGRQQPVRADLELAPGGCYAIVATGGPEVREIELALLAGSAPLGAAQPREPLAILRRCIETAARHRIELRVTQGTGPVLHQVFAAPAAAAPSPAP